MRKFITSSVFILLFSMVSGQVFAGDKSACSEFKDFKANPDYKGLYGLCIAYQNALFHEDQDAMDDLYANWLKKVGDDGIPELPGYVDPNNNSATCPCWPEGETALRGEPMDCLIEGTFALAMYNTTGIEDPFRSFSVGSVYDYEAMANIPNSCEYGENFVKVRDATGMTDAQYDACLNDVSTIIASDFPADLYTWCVGD